MRTLKPIIERVLATHDSARNDDKLLVFYVYRELGFNCNLEHDSVVLVLSNDDLAKMPTFEAITRIRRHIQNKEGRYVPTYAHILVQRQFSQEMVRNIFGDNSNELNGYIFIKENGSVRCR